ncbi:hypothetical protein Mal52_31290 [Symmachiella dynata]|uniref:Uncharacterized protein n=1 Tax=Symmachiella dynata TaxID=2527995 RepID=A0A517ZQG0_9PLAN|nr:hypothetical protein Mal52_31290 [Symmachiella dynata]
MALRSVYELGSAAAGVLTKTNIVTEIIGEDGLRMIAQTLGFEDWKLSWKR